MKIPPFKLERYFAKYEFSAPHLLSCSDCEPLTLKELLALADEEGVRMWDELSLGYTESQGGPQLRSEIAQLYDTIAPENLLVAAPQELIFIAMNALLEKDDHVIVTVPGYQSLYQMAYSLGCEVTKWEVRKEADRWYFDIDELRSAIKKNTKLIVINFPHNPTGALLSHDELNDIVELARSHGIAIFSDEMYHRLEFNSADRLPAVSDLYEDGISLFGMSKSFGLAGLRIGWLSTRNKEILSQCAAFKDYTTICNSAPSEALALIALRARDTIIKRNLDIIQTNLALLDEFFHRYPTIFSWVKPKAGPILFAELLSPVQIDEFCHKVVETKGVMLLPSTVYDYPGNYFRIGFGRKDMPEVLRIFEEYVKEFLKA